MTPPVHTFECLVPEMALFKRIRRMRRYDLVAVDVAFLEEVCH